MASHRVSCAFRWNCLLYLQHSALAFAGRCGAHQGAHSTGNLSLAAYHLALLLRVDAQFHPYYILGTALAHFYRFGVVNKALGQILYEFFHSDLSRVQETESKPLQNGIIAAMPL